MTSAPRPRPPDVRLSRIFHAIPPLLVLVGVQLYRAQHDSENELSVQQQALQQPLQRSARLGNEYCKQAEAQLTSSLGAFPQRWSDRLTLMSAAIDGCTASFDAELALAKGESTASSVFLEDARSLIEKSLCNGLATHLLLADHAAVFTFRLHDSRGKSLTEFEVDGASCATARAVAPPSAAPPEPCKHRIPRGYVPIRDSASQRWFLVASARAHDYEKARYAYTAAEYNERMATQPCPW